MTLQQKERIVESWNDFPWPELLQSARWKRDTRLKTMDDPGERLEIEREYEDLLDRMLANSQIVR